MADQTPVTSAPSPFVLATEPLFKTPVAPETQAQIRAALDALPADHHLALMVHGDLQGNAEARVAFRAGQHWEAVVGGTYSLSDKRPRGYFGVEASF